MRVVRDRPKTFTGTIVFIYLLIIYTPRSRHFTFTLFGRGRRGQLFQSGGTFWIHVDVTAACNGMVCMDDLENLLVHVGRFNYHMAMNRGLVLVCLLC